MSPTSPMDIEHTKSKLSMLESRYYSLCHQAGGDEELRDATMHSLKKLINQLKEELVRYEVGTRT